VGPNALWPTQPKFLAGHLTRPTLQRPSMFKYPNEEQKGKNVLYNEAYEFSSQQNNSNRPAPLDKSPATADLVL